MERRLAAIMAADVVGYSRLMEADEEVASRLEFLGRCYFRLQFGAVPHLRQKFQISFRST